jgi:hypothetical protein
VRIFIVSIAALGLLACHDTETSITAPIKKEIEDEPSHNLILQQRFNQEQREAIEAAKRQFPQLKNIEASPSDMEIGEPETDVFIEKAQSGWRITFIKGWGDCPSGCENHHYWVIFVDKQGGATLEKEEKHDSAEPEPIFSQQQQYAVDLAKQKFPQLDDIDAAPLGAVVDEPTTDIKIERQSEGWQITFIKGWGDFLSGYKHHYWNVFVDNYGTAVLSSETLDDGSETGKNGH